MAVDCGMKLNIIREFVRRGARLTVVPYDFDFVRTDIQYQGLFLSNGPGDPTMARATTEHLRELMAREPPVPIFGICLGNQLMALAAGGRTYKMKCVARAGGGVRGGDC